MGKKCFVLILIALTSLILTGCFDSDEIEDYVYVTMLGIDQGTNDVYRFTFHHPPFGRGPKESDSQAGKGGGEEKDEAENQEIMTIESSSLLGAISIAGTYMSKTFNFNHLKAMVISEELATKGIGDFILTLARYREIRRTTNVVICRDKAKEFIEVTDPYPGTLITQTFEDLLENSELTGLFPSITYNDVFDGMKSPYHSFLITYGAVNEGQKIKDEEQDNEKKEENNNRESGSEGQENKESETEDNKENNNGEQKKQDNAKDGDKSQDDKKQAGAGKQKIPGDYLAGDIPRMGGSKFELMGSAVFDGDKLAGKLTGFETQIVLLIRNDLKTLPITIPDPEKPDKVVAVEAKEFKSPKIKVDLKENKPKIDIELKLEGSITGIQSRIDYEHPQKIKTLEEALSKFLVEAVMRTFEKCKQYKSDVFRFGATAAKQFMTIPEWEEFNWLRKFPQSELNVKVDFTIRRTGKVLKSRPIYSTEGKEE